MIFQIKNRTQPLIKNNTLNQQTKIYFKTSKKDKTNKIFISRIPN